MPARFAYPATVLRDATGGTVTVALVDMPGTAQGSNHRKAMDNASTALEHALAQFIARRQPLPTPSPLGRGQVAVRPSALAMAKAALYEGMHRSGIGRAELARRLGWHLAQVDRILDLSHDSRMDLVERALAALDLRLVVEVDAA